MPVGSPRSLVDRDRLWGRGLSVIDVRLVGSARLAGAALRMRDKRLLAAAAADLGVDVFDAAS